MKVICVNYGYKVHPENPDYVKEGAIYTVKSEVKGYSDLAQREVDCYEFEELSGYFEKACFMPLSNIDEMKFDVLLNVCLKTKPRHKKYDKSRN